MTSFYHPLEPRWFSTGEEEFFELSRLHDQNQHESQRMESSGPMRPLVERIQGPKTHPLIRENDSDLYRREETTGTKGRTFDRGGLRALARLSSDKGSGLDSPEPNARLFPKTKTEFLSELRFQLTTHLGLTGPLALIDFEPIGPQEDTGAIFPEHLQVGVASGPKLELAHGRYSLAVLWIDGKPKNTGHIEHMLGSVRRRLEQTAAIVVSCPNDYTQLLVSLSTVGLKQMAVRTDISAGLLPLMGRTAFVFHRGGPWTDMCVGSQPRIVVRHDQTFRVQPKHGFEFLRRQPFTDFVVASSVGFVGRASGHRLCRQLVPRPQAAAYLLTADAALELLAAGQDSVSIDFQGMFFPEFITMAWEPSSAHLADPVKRLKGILARFDTVRLQRFDREGRRSRPPEWVRNASHFSSTLARETPYRGRRVRQLELAEQVEAWVADKLGGRRNPTSGREGWGDALDTPWFVEVKGTEAESFRVHDEVLVKTTADAKADRRPPLVVVVFLDTAGPTRAYALRPNGKTRALKASAMLIDAASGPEGDTHVSSDGNVWLVEKFERFLASHVARA